MRRRDLLKRSDLYLLIWENPMIHVAKRFGISDVALRKICVKHNIPTPPLGYWAKRAHGKKVNQPSLPPIGKEASDHIHLVERPQVNKPANVVEAELSVVARERTEENKIVVPAERPATLHPTALSVERVLKKAKPDYEGFISCSGPGLVEVKVGPSSAPRAVILIDTLLKALTHRGYNISDDEKGVAIAVDHEIFQLRVQETRDRKAHEPTSEELKQQKERDEWRKRWPELYSSRRETKVYRSWDYFPSGRLSFELFDKDWHPWSATSGHAGRWYDRSAKRAEDYLNASIIAVVSCSALVKHQKAVAAEQARLRYEAALLRKLEEERKQREQKRRSFLAKKAESYSEYMLLLDFAAHFRCQAKVDGTDPIDKMARVLDQMLAEKEKQLDRESLNLEIINASLVEEGDLI